MLICAQVKDLPLNFIHQAISDDSVKDDKCFAKCAFEKSGFVSKNGKLLMDKIKKMIVSEKNNPSQQFVVGEEKCINGLDENDVCLATFTMLKCFANEYMKQNNNEN